jgi:hypothetical protein
MIGNIHRPALHATCRPRRRSSRRPGKRSRRGTASISSRRLSAPCTSATTVDWLSKVQSVDQRMRLECGVGVRQRRTCRRTRPGQLCARRRHQWLGAAGAKAEVHLLAARALIVLGSCSGAPAWCPAFNVAVDGPWIASHRHARGDESKSDNDDSVVFGLVFRLHMNGDPSIFILHPQGRFDAVTYLVRL